jgi:hypothetical protein
MKSNNHWWTPSKYNINKVWGKWIWSVVTRNEVGSCSKIQCTPEYSELMSGCIWSIYHHKARPRLLWVCHVESNVGPTPVLFAFLQTNMQTDNKTICFFILKYKRWLHMQRTNHFAASNCLSDCINIFVQFSFNKKL